MNLEVLSKLSLEALKALQEGVQQEIDRRMDYTLRIGDECYAIVNGEKRDYILEGIRRTRAQVQDKTGKRFLIARASLKSYGRPLETPPPPPEKRSGKPSTEKSVLTW